MGRKASAPGAIPRFRIRRNADGTVRYYYDHGLVKGRRVIEPLGTDRVRALQRWAELEGKRLPTGEKAVYTFRMLAAEYRKRELPQKAPDTQRLYDTILTRLTDILADKPLDEISPADVANIWHATQEKRGTVMANRTKAVLSTVFNCGRLLGMTKNANPCTGVRGKKEAGRKSVLISDALYQAVYEVADQPLRNAMDLADLTSQRPGDVLPMSEANIVGNLLYVRQKKTGAVVVIEIVGKLAALIERLRAWTGTEIVKSPYLIRDERGARMTRGQLRSRFDKAREKAGIPKEDFQFRDLRARGVTRKVVAEGLEEGQRLAGHSSPGMTAHYTRGTRPVKPSH
ncbi:tyrosine-type recombinase/integrase [Ralstonia mannitolilytica]|uniref:tyrosine-type recombinase/integrase n=1 Tax=Ralstonia mannitolilytica TaxID=105219 RepID=UPI0028F61BBC|nr:tyrosine-type recombinase/integrase [Ralstonia mannitolilytica]CAJ0742875.1 hypothetical protein R76696_04201 [Ralstonia mannitolilytica]